MERLRIDKWLWAARIFKTRSLASHEVDRGRVQVNGADVKPAKEVKSGDTLEIRIGSVTRQVNVTALSDKRGPASAAALLYRETEESIANRIAAAERNRLAPEPALGLVQGRPTKHDRRQTDTLRRQSDDSAPGWNDRWSASLDS